MHEASSITALKIAMLRKPHTCNHQLVFINESNDYTCNLYDHHIKYIQQINCHDLKFDRSNTRKCLPTSQLSFCKPQSNEHGIMNQPSSKLIILQMIKCIQIELYVKWRDKFINISIQTNHLYDMNKLFLLFKTCAQLGSDHCHIN